MKNLFIVFFLFIGLCQSVGAAESIVDACNSNIQCEGKMRRTADGKLQRCNGNSWVDSPTCRTVEVCAPVSNPQPFVEAHCNPDEYLHSGGGACLGGGGGTYLHDSSPYGYWGGFWRADCYMGTDPRACAKAICCKY